jgi:hypothetical protein
LNIDARVPLTGRLQTKPDTVAHGPAPASGDKAPRCGQSNKPIFIAQYPADICLTLAIQSAALPCVSPPTATAAAEAAFQRGCVATLALQASNIARESASYSRRATDGGGKFTYCLTFCRSIPFDFRSEVELHPMHASRVAGYEVRLYTSNPVAVH